jgi:peptidoglycan hydrolase-like protein with peptidoglycan-binding domain
MEIFSNVTNDKNEKAVKIGKTVPPDAANIALFSQADPSPATNLSVIDFSDTIPENRIGSETKTSFMIANEIGVLEDFEGNSSIPTANLTISDTLLRSDYRTDAIDPYIFNPSEYLHSFYVSKYFVSARKDYLNFNLNSVPEDSYYAGINIKVLDSKNQDYVDPNTGRKKYKIILEPYRTNLNFNLSEIPYRVIVCFDAQPAKNIKLVYDRFEVDSDGLLSNPILNFTENVNSVPYFKEQVEESLVLDPNNSNEKHYAVKKYNKKYSDIYNESIDTSGYQVFVPKKAILDNRSFEVFNWRLIAKAKQSINLELVDYGISFGDITTQAVKTVSACVLYDSLDTVKISNTYPYVFLKLGNSAFNFSKLGFTNPNATETNPQKSAYWLVDIQSIDSLKDYDVVAFAPTSRLSEKATQIIESYIKENSGTVLIDASRYPAEQPILSDDIKIQPLGTTQIQTHYSYNTASKILDEDKNGAWNIDSTIFEKDTYGIFGNKKDYYRKINTSSLDSKILSIGTSSSNASPVAIHKEYPSLGDSLSQGNLIVTSFDLLQYCNAIYNPSGDGSLISTNTGSTAVFEQSGQILSGVVEGPYKFLYNIVAYALYGRAHYKNVKESKSLIYNYVSEWNSSWVMDQEALLEDEKIENFVTIPSSDNSVKFGRDIIPTYNSLRDYYKKLLTESLPNYFKDKISLIDLSNVEYFIEVTNPDVEFSNAGKVYTTQEILNSNIPTAYYLHKVENADLKAYAYTEKPSAKLTVPEEFGPYIIKESMTLKTSDTKKINNKISPVNEFKSYSFDLATDYTYTSATDKPVQFSGSIQTNVELLYRAKLDRLVKSKRTGYVLRNYKVDKKIGTQKGPLIKEAVNIPAEYRVVDCINIKSSIDSNLFKDGPDSDQPYNNFNYTGDLGLGNSTNTWNTSYARTSHRYVKFLQVALKSASRYDGRDTPIDGKYGSKMEAGVKAFQRDMKSRGYRVLYEDGTVDSETKSLIQSWLKYLQITNPGSYDHWRGKASDNGVLDFWDRAVSRLSLADVNLSGDYNKISFTGFEGPTKIMDVLYFSIPEGYQNIKAINIDFGRWSNVKVVSYGWSNVDSSNQQLTKTERLAKYPNNQLINRTPSDASIHFSSTNSVTIGLHNSTQDCKHFFVRIETNGKLDTARYGRFAEGYSITSIRALVSTFAVNEPPVYGPDKDILSAISYTEKYEAVDSLITPPDQAESTKGLNENEYFASGLLTYNKSLGTLQSSLLNHKVFTRSDRKYYNWNGTIWVEVFPLAVAYELSDQVIEEHYSYIETDDIIVKAFGTTQENFNGLSPTNDISFIYDSSKISSQDLSISKIEYYYPLGDTPRYVTETFNTPKRIKDGFYKTDLGVSLNFSSVPSQVYISNTIQNPTAVTKLSSDKGETMVSPQSIVSIDYLDPIQRIINPSFTKVKLSTSATYYGSSELVKSPKIPLTEYTAVSLDNRILDSRSSVTANDGIILIANVNNETISPVGFPTYNDIVTTMQVLPDGFERNIRFGYVTVYNSIDHNGGFIYGFYDISAKEFIGRTISYIDLEARGKQNVFIAVCAIDADGNSQNLIDYIGPKVNTTFVPVNLSLKKICPVYSVRYNTDSAIKIADMSMDLEKDKAWPLQITRGSFNKYIHINSNIYTDWKKDYLNQELKCTYDTSSLYSSGWSNIFGPGYYDVKEENPIIISNSSIKVRQFPFAVWEEPGTIESSEVGVIRPQFKVYINTDKPVEFGNCEGLSGDSMWVEVDYSYIKNYNSELGTIELYENIVPSNSDDVRVSYVSASNNVRIYQVNGVPVPLNPVLNNDSLIANKPLYIYIMPSKIEKKKAVLNKFASYESIPEYSNTNIINFTYNKDIFDPAANGHDPFALLLGVVTYVNTDKMIEVYDTRVRGGGVSTYYSTEDAVLYSKKTLSYWDMYPSNGMAYPKGGYAIIKLPNEVKANFQTVQEIYTIVRNNLTAGVSFEIQDMDGNPFGVM